MPTLIEQIEPLLLTAFEAWVGTNVYWQDQRRPYAGPGATGIGGMQGTITVSSIVDVGDDRQVPHEVPVTVERPAGIEIRNQGTREIVVSFELWSWSQKAEYNPHGYMDRVRSQLMDADDTERQTLGDNGIVPFEILSDTPLTSTENKRRLLTAVMDVRFRVSPEELPRAGSVIETVQIEAHYGGGVNPHLETHTVGGPITSRVLWTPADARRPLVWWAGHDALTPQKHWIDRLKSYHLEPMGSGFVDVDDASDHVSVDMLAYLATTVDVPTHATRSQYIWAYAQVHSIVGAGAEFFAAFLDFPLHGFLAAPVDDDRKILVAVYVTATEWRLDVDGVAGVPTAHADPLARSGLQILDFGGTANGPATYQANADVYDVGIVEDEDIREKLLGYVRAQYK